MGEERPSPIFRLFIVNRRNGNKSTALPSGQLFLLMTILSQSFFAFVRGHLVAFSFLSAWHFTLN